MQPMDRRQGCPDNRPPDTCSPIRTAVSNRVVNYSSNFLLLEYSIVTFHLALMAALIRFNDDS